MDNRMLRVPEYREGEAAGSYMRRLTLFLKDFTSTVWAANNRRKKEIAALREEIAALNTQAQGSAEGE